MASRRNSQVGARSVGDGGNRRGGWWKWLLLLLLLVALVILLISLLGGNDKKKSSSSATTTTQSQSAQAGSASAGKLTAGGTSLLPVPSDLSTYVGSDATGQNVVVQKVDGQQGFWVGNSMRDRVYVEYGAKAGGTEQGAAFKPTVGQRVDLRGPIRPAPAEPGRVLKIAGADEDLVKQQGAYINADTVRAAG